MATILSIAPYKYLKPRNGGHWGIFAVESVLSIHNKVFTLSVQSNEPFESPFTQLNILTDKKSRYLPYALTNTIIEEARKVKADYILCHHPYLYFSVKKAAKILNIPFFIRSHNIESERFRSMGKAWWRLLEVLEKKAYIAAKKVFFVTEEDALWAHNHFGLRKTQSVVLPYAIQANNFEMTKVSKEVVAALHQLNPNIPWLCFMGDLGYAPNQEAVKNIVENIYPKLKETSRKFEIIICGKGLPQPLQDAINHCEEIHYLGFVEDLKSILNHSDIMLNAVTFGGGVKIKVLEALSENLTVISTENGALGINAKVCGEKLIIVKDGDWDNFSKKVAEQLQNPKTNIPNTYFEYYYFKNIADRIQSNF
ncbi:MAG TPA: glycosyltransferase family 4 protein [Edaphocola sp.]|nr:glycosyltransferase family 4 protein [Edaphocola sp.]